MSAINIQTTRKEKLIKLPKEYKSRFLETLKIQSNKSNQHIAVAYIITEVLKLGLTPKVDNVGNIIVEKGCDVDKFVPGICSHIDTVHKIYDNYSIHVENKNDREIVYAESNGKQVGTGGDDKNGVFACLYMLEKFDNIKAFFFVEEETGFIGSNNIDDNEFNNVGYIIQLDRWGRGDFISSYMSEDTISNKYKQKVTNVLDKYGYKHTEGLITDTINLWNNELGISAVNVSCGYYSHHTPKETIDLNEFYNSLLFTEELIKTLGCNLYPSKPRLINYHNKYHSYDDEYYDNITTSNWNDDEYYDNITTSNWNDDDWDLYTRGGKSISEVNKLKSNKEPIELLDEEYDLLNCMLNYFNALEINELYVIDEDLLNKALKKYNNMNNTKININYLFKAMNNYMLLFEY